MRLQDLVRLAAHINSMDLFELEPSDFSVIKQISDRISAGIIELDERSIYDLIRAKNIGKAPGLQKIYEEIFKNIFAEINEKGESELGHDSIFRVLSYLSDKLNLSKATAPEQAKFFSWLEKYARTCARE
uniref:Predicted protein n=1 Tax=Hordeum vulgare subsp. vulgare TaxID=112509 RepID=F2DYD9_HORVV|nr:predicted protein [Hordeum vulgare subsp. vulgare]